MLAIEKARLEQKRKELEEETRKLDKKVRMAEKMKAAQMEKSNRLSDGSDSGLPSETGDRPGKNAQEGTDV